MNKRIVGALLLLLLGVVAIVGVRYLLPRVQDMQQRATSDARSTKGKITVAVDNWIGYFPLRSPEMVGQLRRGGWILAVQDDNADYEQRMKRLRAGEIDFAVATLDSYILNAASVNFPGTIVMVIDESKGGDAIVGWSDKVPSLDAVRKAPVTKVAFTPNSPSHYLLKAAAYHFNIPNLLPPPGENRIETKGSEQALSKLLAGKTDLAVMWEPDVSRALAQPGVVKILGTEETTRLIVDVLIVNRKFSEKHPETVKSLFSTYFTVLKRYKENAELLRNDVMKETGLPETAVDTMLKGVRWVNLTENCEKWFGLAGAGGSGDEGIVRAIESTVNILMNAGDFVANPIPGADPRRLTNSVFMEDLCVKGVQGFAPRTITAGQGDADGLAAGRFEPLSPQEWSRLKEVGTLKIDPVIFQQGGTELDVLAKQVIDKAAELLKHYPKFRVVIRGHTGNSGDAAENRLLSQERADAVARYLTVAYTVDANRLLAVGLGGEDPLPREPGESFRSWQYRLPRVELVLVREEY